MTMSGKGVVVQGIAVRREESAASRGATVDLDWRRAR